MRRLITLVLGALAATLSGLGADVRPAEPRDGAAAARLIVETADPAAVDTRVRALGGRPGRRLPAGGAVVADLPDDAVAALAASPAVRRITPDRRLAGTLAVTSTAVGAAWVAERLGFDGAGIGVAIIDSGVAAGHRDLADRVVHFVDFVKGQPQPHDGYGHGTHVAGIIAGNGHDSDGARRGVAPGAQLVVLKALDDEGDGYISDAIAAMDYAVEHRAAFNIRVINLSVAAGVYESYRSDPLTLAAGRAVAAGLVVVTAAGNLGQNAAGEIQYGGITAPGNAPWVLTVGAASHHGTVDRIDDTVAGFSSRGPSSIDLVAKPDLVAPGVGIESAADTGSTLFARRPAAHVWGTPAEPRPPYLSLSGTSMAAPVVAGAVALMLQANAALTPAEVKAVLQATAERHEAYTGLAQGAGFLDAWAAVEFARRLAANPAAADRLGDLVGRYAPREGVQPPCEAADAQCREFARAHAACAEAPGCFVRLAGAAAGGTLPGGY